MSGTVVQGTSIQSTMSGTGGQGTSEQSTGSQCTEYSFWYCSTCNSVQITVSGTVVQVTVYRVVSGMY